MPTYTVKSVNRQKSWKGKYGDMVSYYCVLENEGGNQAEVEIAQKVTTTPPSEGQKLEGTVEKGDYGLKFKKDAPAGGGGGFRGGPRPDDPATRDSIERQVAVKAAAEVFAGQNKIPDGDEVLRLTAAFLEAMRSKAA